ncbi:MAG: hypothetical protein F4Y27_12250 [Acidimicrobiaceae bacterium]|nr:hypothetical protein [Acidimicrobiaceae bacterium]MYJ99070.1 hypothetical protein [Acidimicrobiaceae bacterium]
MSEQAMSEQAMSEQATHDTTAAVEPPTKTTTGIDISGPPQEMYKFLRDHMPVMTVDHELMKGTSVALLDDVMTVLQNPQIFSSDGAAEIGQIRPLIPLEIDPPRHAKYRKLLDPLFAPRPGGVARTVDQSAGGKSHRSSRRSRTLQLSQRHRRAASEPGVPDHVRTAR